MADSENPASEINSAGEQPKAPQITAGQMLRDARTRAGVTVAKVSGDLRISASVLEALEAGDYSKLAGAPYIRALLVSLSRYLHLDSKDVLQAYGEEIGSEPAATVPVSPYKDDSKTHAKAHKQIFILLLAVLLFVLLLIMGKVNSSSSDDYEAPAAPTNTDTLLNIDPVMESDSLSLDSLDMDSTATDTMLLLDTIVAPKQSKAVQTTEKVDPKAVKPEVRTEATKVTPPAAKETTPPKEATKEATSVRVQALSDSVYIRVIRAGRRESSRTLAPGQSIEVRHDDVITFITRNSNTVEVTAGGTVVIPDKRRFKVTGSSITY
jgi:cytoskeleton protein RodZ